MEEAPSGLAERQRLEECRAAEGAGPLGTAAWGLVDMVVGSKNGMSRGEDDEVEVNLGEPW